MGQLNWAGVGSSTIDDPSSSSPYPSATDLARNFDQDDSNPQNQDEGHYDDPDSFEDEDDADDPLYPGIYRALFAFDPEGTAEVRLREDQLVRVVKRGGGVGWAVVEVGWRASKELVRELRESGELDVGEGEGDNGEGERGEGDGGKEETGGVEVELPDGRKLRQGLVPESYLAPVRLDGWVDCS